MLGVDDSLVCGRTGTAPEHTEQTPVSGCLDIHVVMIGVTSELEMAVGWVQALRKFRLGPSLELQPRHPVPPTTSPSALALAAASPCPPPPREQRAHTPANDSDPSSAALTPGTDCRSPNGRQLQAWECVITNRSSARPRGGPTECPVQPDSPATEQARWGPYGISCCQAATATIQGPRPRGTDARDAGCGVQV